MRTAYRFPALAVSMIAVGSVVFACLNAAVAVTTLGTAGDATASLIYDSANGSVTVDANSTGYKLSGLTIQSAGHNLLPGNWTGPKGALDFFTGRNDLLGFNGTFSNSTVSPEQSVGLVLMPGLARDYLLQDLTIVYFRQGQQLQYTGDLIFREHVGPYTWLGQDATHPTDWGVAANWDSNSVPGGAGTPLVFGSAGTGATVDLISGDRTAGTLSLMSGTSTVVQSSGEKTLTLDNGANPAQIDVAGQHSFAASLMVKLASDTLVNLGASDSRLAISGNISEASAGKALGIMGNGTLRLAGTNTYSGGTFVLGGTLAIDKVGALPPGRSLTIEAAGTLVLKSGLGSPAGAAGSAGAATAVPEPATLALLIAAAALLAVWRRKN